MTRHNDDDHGREYGAQDRRLFEAFIIVQSASGHDPEPETGPGFFRVQVEYPIMTINQHDSSSPTGVAWYLFEHGFLSIFPSEP